MVVLTYGKSKVYIDITITSHKVFYMSFAFQNRLCVFKKTIKYDKMEELGSDLYEEILRFQTQETNYFPQTIDLSMYREGHFKKAA